MTIQSREELAKLISRKRLSCRAVQRAEAGCRLFAPKRLVAVAKGTAHYLGATKRARIAKSLTRSAADINLYILAVGRRQGDCEIAVYA